jgi:hypothetical protein
MKWSNLTGARASSNGTWVCDLTDYCCGVSVVWLGAVANSGTTYVYEGPSGAMVWIIVWNSSHEYSFLGGFASTPTVPLGSNCNVEFSGADWFYGFTSNGYAPQTSPPLGTHPMNVFVTDEPSQGVFGQFSFGGPGNCLFTSVAP